jgi:hypothetical protein
MAYLLLKRLRLRATSALWRGADTGAFPHRLELQRFG